MSSWCENVVVHCRLEKIKKMCNVMGIDMVYDPDPSYELTADNVKKMLAIYMRFRSCLTPRFSPIHASVCSLSVCCHCLQSSSEDDIKTKLFITDVIRNQGYAKLWDLICIWIILADSIQSKSDGLIWRFLNRLHHPAPVTGKLRLLVLQFLCILGNVDLHVQLTTLHNAICSTCSQTEWVE